MDGDDEREGMSILLEESGECVICTLQRKQTPKRYIMAPESLNRKSDHKIYSKGSKERCSKKIKKKKIDLKCNSTQLGFFL